MSDSDLHFLADVLRMAVSRALRQFERHAASCFLGSNLALNAFGTKVVCGRYSEGLSNAAKDADILFIEGITRKNIKYAPWGGDTEKQKVYTIGAYHMFPSDMKKLQDKSGVKNIVMVHVQNYNSPENFDQLSVLQEMIDEGVTNILQASDGDLY